MNIMTTKRVEKLSVESKRLIKAPRDRVNARVHRSPATEAMVWTGKCPNSRSNR